VYHLQSMKYYIVIFIALMGLFSCVSYGHTERSITRTDTDTTVDLSGKWNDADSRIVAETISTDLVNGGWLFEFGASESRRPVVIVGNMRNESSEHISIESFVKDIEREMVNSTRIEVVASALERINIRTERVDQQDQASEETRALIREETGADFMMIGVITSQTDAVVGQKVVLYQVDVELIDIESNRKVWIGSTKIKKEIRQENIQ